MSVHVVDKVEAISSEGWSAETMSIVFEQLSVAVNVGIHDHERGKPQVVLLDAELDYEFNESDPVAYLDYERLSSEIATYLLLKPHTDLLEQLARDLSTWTFSRYSEVTKIRLHLRKARARPNAKSLSVRFSAGRPTST